MTDRSEQLDELATALSAAQAEFAAIPKTADNPFFKSKFADLPAVVKAAAPVLTKHGLSVSQFLGVDEGGDTLTTWLLHRSGQFLSEAMRLYSSPGKGQSAAQGLGSATTFGRRYAYMAVLGLVADEDDDGNSAPQAAAPQSSSERVASEKQRGLINVRANEAGVPPSVLANILKVAAGSDVTLWETEDEAAVWLEKALPRLPARLVNTVLESIEREKT